MKIWHVCTARPEHIGPIAANLREADRREVWASHRHSPLEALESSLAASELAWTCFVRGAPAFMWGVGSRGSLISLTGAPWLLGTSAVYEIRREFLRQSRPYVDLMQERFARLENYVHAGNALSRRWLKWCGFTLAEEPEAINGESFYKFWRERCAT